MSITYDKNKYSDVVGYIIPILTARRRFEPVGLIILLIQIFLCIVKTKSIIATIDHIVKSNLFHDSVNLFHDSVNLLSEIKC